MKKYIHVNKHVIARNARHNEDNPPVRIQRGKYGRSTYCNEVEIKGPSKMVYSAHDPILPCGARLVILVEDNVEVEIVR